MTPKKIFFAIASACAIFASAPAKADYAGSLASGMGQQAAMRNSAFLKSADEAKIAGAFSYARDAMTLAAPGFRDGLYTFSGGAVFGAGAAPQDDDLSSFYFLDNFCEVFDSGSGRSVAFERDFPGSLIRQVLFLHELAHCQHPNMALDAQSPAFSPVASRLAYIALSHQNSLWTKTASESFADAHALLALRQLRPEAWRRAMETLSAKRWAEAVAFGYFDVGAKGNEHATQHAVLWLADQEAQGKIPPRLTAAQTAQLAFEAAILGNAAAASKMPWLARSAKDASDNKTLCASSAQAGIADALAFDFGVADKYKLTWAVPGGGMGRLAVSEAQKSYAKLAAAKASAAELDKFKSSLSQELCRSPGKEIPLSFSEFLPLADAIEKRLPSEQVLSKAQKTLARSLSSDAAVGKPPKAPATFAEAAEILLNHRIPFPRP